MNGDGGSKGGDADGGDDGRMELLRKRLESLTAEHGDLDAAIEAMTADPLIDAMRLGRMKKRKLAIKDEIRAIRRRLLPDIIA